MQLSYQLTESDYRQGFKAFRTRTAYRRWLIRIAYFIFFFMVVLGLLTTFARRAFGELWPLYLLLLFWGYYLWYGPYMIGRRTMKGSPSARTAGPLTSRTLVSMTKTTSPIRGLIGRCS